MLSLRAKESIKTALAMAITYAASMSMDWDRPKWAALVVAVCSLASVGQSLNKAVTRLFGTLVAAVVALAIIGLFPQDR